MIDLIWGNVMLEGADPEVFGWYVKSDGPEVSRPGG
jgi:hypothetical protein